MNRGLFSKVFIEEVRAASDIVAVISDYVRLKKTGQNFVGLCPFHSENTPSFTVSRQRQMFYCFGCNTGGDVFEFIQKQEAIDFPEAVRLLAKRAHIPVPQQSPAAQKREAERQALYLAGELAQKFYQHNLQQRQLGVRARTYLKQRGIDENIAKEFGLGFAPDEWEGVIKFLRMQGLSVAIAVKAGLAIPRPQGGGAYDRFRGRLMFPIRDFQGRVVAFGGRMLGPGEPKYLNSPETLIYNKGHLLYGLDRARPGIQRTDKVLIVEGYLDVLACHQFGFDYAVASLGTALTQDQLRLIKRFTTNILIGYDADRAGHQATVRGLELARRERCQVKILPLPANEDPDDVIRKQGPQSFSRLVENALPVPVYHFERLLHTHDIGSLEGRIAVAEAMVPHLAGIKNLVEREEYTKKVAQKLNLDQHLIKTQIEASRRAQTKGADYKQDRGQARQSLMPAVHQAEMAALLGLGSLFLNCPQLRLTIGDSISKEWLGNQPLAKVLAVMLTLFEQSGSDFSLSDLKNKLPDAKTQAALAQLAVHPVPACEPMTLIAHYADRIKLIWIQKEIGSLRQEINSQNRAGKTEDSANLIRRLADLHREEVLLKQLSSGRDTGSGWLEGGTRHAEKR